MNRPAVQFDVCSPFLRLLPPRNPFDAARVSATAPSVSRVLGNSRKSQVRNAVVEPVPINVIKTLLGPHPIDMQPRQPVRAVQPSAYVNPEIAGRGDCPRGPPSRSARAAPREGPREWIVVKDRADEIGGKVFPRAGI